MNKAQLLSYCIVAYIATTPKLNYLPSKNSTPRKGLRIKTWHTLYIIRLINFVSGILSFLHIIDFKNASSEKCKPTCYDFKIIVTLTISMSQLKYLRGKTYQDIKNNHMYIVSGPTYIDRLYLLSQTYDPLYISLFF